MLLQYLAFQDGLAIDNRYDQKNGNRDNMGQKNSPLKIFHHYYFITIRKIMLF
jgi:hypothetical protein